MPDMTPSPRTDERIRREICRLDGITGLHGADLPVTYNRSKHTLGCFHCLEKPYFTFSLFWFEDPKWPEQSFLDVVRHEYAHYMNWELYGGTDHGKSWKACCNAVGAVSTRLYSDDVNTYYVKKNARDAAVALRYGTYEVGRSIVHPQFGRGMIVRAVGEGPSRILDVRFAAVGIKRLGAAWVDQNCAKG